MSGLARISVRWSDSVRSLARWVAVHPASALPSKSELRWDGLALVLAHAAAFVIIGFAGRTFSRLTLTQWVCGEFGLALLFWLPARIYTHRVFKRLLSPGSPTTRRPTHVLLPLALAILVAAWWWGSFPSVLPLRGARTREFFGFVLGVSWIVALTAVYTGLFTLTATAVRYCSADSRQEEQTPRCAQADSGLRSNWGAFGCFALFLTVANGFAVWYIRQEQTLYCWDFDVYWQASTHLVETSRTSGPFEVWDVFRRWAQTEDYGPLPVLLPSGVVAVFGNTRLIYVLTIVNIYLVGLALAARHFVGRLVPGVGVSLTTVPLLVVLLCPVAWASVLRGYPDIGGAALGVIALFTYLSRPVGGLSGKQILFLAALLAGMALFRRWYSFFLVAFMVAASLDTLRVAVRASARGGWRAGLQRSLPLGLVGVWTGVFLLSFAVVWAARVATTDYGQLLAAYRLPGSLAERAWIEIDRIGPGWVGAAIAGFAILIRFPDTRRIALVVGVMPPVMLVHFLKAQNFGFHHFSLFLPALVLLPALALLRIVREQKRVVRYVSLMVVGAVGLAAMAVGFVPAAIPTRPALRPVVSRDEYPPLRRNDLGEFRRLLWTVEVEAARTDSRVTVVASSLTCTGTMFASANRSLDELIFKRERLRLCGETDRVSGFPLALFQTELVVVASPPQTHLDPSEQQVVVQPALSLLNGTDIGAAFERLPDEFHLADPLNGSTVTLFIYRRQRAITTAECEAFVNRLCNSHPDQPQMLRPPLGLEKWLAYPIPRN